MINSAKKNHHTSANKIVDNKSANKKFITSQLEKDKIHHKSAN